MTVMLCLFLWYVQDLWKRLQDFTINKRNTAHLILNYILHYYSCMCGDDQESFSSCLAAHNFLKASAAPCWLL